MRHAQMNVMIGDGNMPPVVGITIGIVLFTSSMICYLFPAIPRIVGNTIRGRRAAPVQPEEAKAIRLFAGTFAAVGFLAFALSIAYV